MWPWTSLSTFLETLSSCWEKYCLAYSVCSFAQHYRRLAHGLSVSCCCVSYEKDQHMASTQHNEISLSFEPLEVSTPLLCLFRAVGEEGRGERSDSRAYVGTRYQELFWNLWVFFRHAGWASGPFLKLFANAEWGSGCNHDLIALQFAFRICRNHVFTQ